MVPFVKISLVLGSCLVILQPVFAQVSDTVAVVPDLHIRLPNAERKRFPVKAFILPTLAVAYGFSSLESNSLKGVNTEVKEEVWIEEPHAKTRLDDYLQWSPAALTYGLSLAGIHAKNNLRDRTMIYLMSQVFMNASVSSLKRITHEERPDGSNGYSFPSGHTANAFLGADYMWHEYKDVSPWLGASGFLLAAATGYLRLYNNKHWVSDVVAGAGFGIASTELSYWLYPRIRHYLFKDKLANTAIMPVIQKGSFGLGLAKQF